MEELILFLISVLPVFLLGLFIYKKDKNKEPIKLLVKLFVGGILSCFLVLFISMILGIVFPIFSADSDTLNAMELLVYVFIGVALVEEFCKWIFSYKLAYNDYHFEEIFDMIVYCVFVSLGFAFFENLFYVYDNGIATGIIRALSAVPGHACYGVFMGYYLALAKRSQLDNKDEVRKKYIFNSIFVPTILHGIYDYCLFIGNLFFFIIFIIFVICIYVFTLKKIKKMSSLNKKIKYFNNYCPMCGTKVESSFCPMCGNKND